MTASEANRHATDIRESAIALNEAIRRGAEAGLKIDVETNYADLATAEGEMVSVVDVRVYKEI